MTDYIKERNLKVAQGLYNFINSKALPGSGVHQEKFWSSFDELIGDLVPKNKELLQEREKIQHAIDEWHRKNRHFQRADYKAFLKEIHYIENDVEDFRIHTKNVDKEITLQAGPQLVVPVCNARYALNAANARWGSLYDALYGSDIIDPKDGAEIKDSYNPVRGGKVVQYAKEFLDSVFPLAGASHLSAEKYVVEKGSLFVVLENGTRSELEDTAKFSGYQGSPENPNAVLLNNNDLHIELQINRSHPIGAADKAGIKDVMVESAITTIMDCEDSVAAVDAEDKVEVYENWLGLMKGDLEASFYKGKKKLTRSLHQDRAYLSPQGKEFTVPGRSLMLVRNVGHLMTTTAVLDQNNNPVPEGILDAVITGLIATHDILGNSRFKNSKEGSVYIVKPKMHGSKEVAFANELFDRVEDMLDMQRNTIKIGIMDEERRTSINLKACINKSRERVVFINTGFLDRTGDEMHTSMEAGPMIRKKDMKSTAWLHAYEKNNVNAGLRTGFIGTAQIGKGMWAMPNKMKAMMDQKGAQLSAGASTAWVPSPTAATLHALHYHKINVKEVQSNLQGNVDDNVDDMLDIPIEENPAWTKEEIQAELDNNAQGILGYVVRWVDQGIGCSKVPNIEDIELMEDRATLRISSQHMANWLYHGIGSREQVQETLERMAGIVDSQNEGDPKYRPMSDNFAESVAFQAACDLVYKGCEQPSGYTEPILHRRRQEAKAKQ